MCQDTLWAVALIGQACEVPDRREVTPARTLGLASNLNIFLRLCTVTRDAGELWTSTSSSHKKALTSLSFHGLRNEDVLFIRLRAIVPAPTRTQHLGTGRHQHRHFEIRTGRKVPCVNMSFGSSSSP